VIRSKFYHQSKLQDAPDSFQSAPISARGFPETRYTLQIYLEDCTGCGLCVEDCPAYDPEDNSVKAINMEQKAPVFESVLRVCAVDVDVAMQAVESLLGEFVKRWQFGSVVHESDGTHVIEYAIQLRKSITPAAFIEALQARGATVIMDVEIQ